ncbi:MAG TPA: DNA-deoxyinosine glycosylase [Xanthomonadaceae bacterium]|nr:DNA-deoxyinosine glycosylase [Xanthomonadaceae bacterium]
MLINAAARPSARINGFPPIEHQSARILILGSMPGEASLRAGQYYAHPQNSFWRILGEIFGAAHDASYADRLRMLKSNGIALWDVLASCVREGSLDAAIAPGTLVANDFASFFQKHRRIERVLFNGAKAEACFRRHVVPSLESRAIRYVRLPSTSPANASIAYAKKIAAWRDALAPTIGPAKLVKPA